MIDKDEILRLSKYICQLKAKIKEEEDIIRTLQAALRGVTVPKPIDMDSIAPYLIMNQGETYE